MTGRTPAVDEEIMSVAEEPPEDDGLKITWKVQLAPASRFGPQFELAMEKLAAVGPVI